MGKQISILVTTTINCASQLLDFGLGKAQVTLTYPFMLKIMELDSTIVYNNENLDLTDAQKYVINKKLWDIYPKEYNVAIKMIL